jgi:hypothetical protein
MSMLYLHAGGRVEGPFDPAEVRRRLSAGELTLRTMSWKAGEKRWKSLARRWPNGLTLDHILGACGPLLVFVLAVLMLGIPGRLYSHLPDALQTEIFIAGAVGTALACSAIVTLVLVYRNWKGRRRLSLPYALCLMLTLMTGAASVALCTRTIGMVKAENSFPNAVLHYDAASREVLVRGSIGHRFSSDLAGMLHEHADASAIVIDSPGGLVDEAFKAADTIKQAQLPLRADGICASACALMWAAVPRREMMASSRIGLHQNRLIGDVPVELTVGASRQMEEESTDALTSAGFTDEMLRRRAATPPAKMYWLNAVDIMTASIDAKVLNTQGQQTDIASAKWMVVSSAWGKGSLTEQLYQAIGQHEPAIVDTYENRLYEALRSNNIALFSYEDRTMEGDVIRQAFAQVSDQAVMDWASSRQRDLAQASEAMDQPACSMLEGAAKNASIYGATRKWVSQHALVRTIALVNAIPDTTALPAAQFAVQKAANDFATYSQGILTRLKPQGYPASSALWTMLQRCNYSNQFLLGVEQLPLADGAEIVRYGETRRRSQ